MSLIDKDFLRSTLHTDVEIRPFSELVDQDLVLRGAGNGEIKYKGNTLLPVKLESETRDVELIVPFLVSSSRMKSPILGTNAIEELLDETELENLMTKLGIDKVEINEVKTELEKGERSETERHPTTQNGGVTSEFTRKKKSEVKMTRRLRVIPAGEVGWLDCKLEPPIHLEKDQPLLFQASESLPPGVRPLDVIVPLKKGLNTKIRVEMRNKTSKSYWLERRETIGMVEEITAITPV